MAELFCFGRFTLDPDTRQLCSDGAPASVGATAVGILLALVEQAGQTVSKDALMSRVWGHAAVGDNRLHVHIYELRKAIGDDCIVSKSGRGYRFVAPVHRGPAEDRSAQPAGLRSGNLPVLKPDKDVGETSRLIGRADALKNVSQSLSEGRLVTLTGPGGVGKTSLALHVAQSCAAQFADGVWLVELAALNDGALAPGAVATVLGVKVGQSATPLETLARQLARKNLLVVLDNCEHVVAAAGLLAEALLQAAPGLKILATSREALSCIGERIFDVPPLTLPADAMMPPAQVRETAAIRLFVDRVRNADSRFQMDDDDVSVAARICRRVDGLPLAIEMVSGWVGVLGLRALDARLDGSLKAWLRARSTAPARHSTLRATLEWSHDLLSDEERLVLRRLAVFANAFTMPVAEAVIADHEMTLEQVFEHLANLIRKSMVALLPGAGSRSYRLMDTTRAFALEKLADSKDGDLTRQRHAHYLLCTLELAIDEWETTGDAVWLQRYAPLVDDLRGALDWALGQESDHAVALAGASWPLWRELSLLVEGRKWLRAAEARLRPTTPPALEARLRRGLGELWANTGSVKAAHDEFVRATHIYRTLNDRASLGGALSRQAFALLMLGRPVEAQQGVEEALALLQQVRSPRTLGTAYSTQLCVEARFGRYDEARTIGERAVRLCEMTGADRTAFVVSGNLMECSLERGDITAAIDSGRDLVTRLRNTSHSDVLAFVLGLLGAALTERGDLDEALTAARQAAQLLRDEGMLFGQFDHLALRAGLAGRVRDAARIIGYADWIYRATGRPREPIGERAATRLSSLLGAALTENEIAVLKDEGALLTEEQAMSLALGV